ncbi:hypothetical protein BDW22DRAFT_1405228 [Trametopsis cervina]|nr:hypothetical protein BDW22DRAFT_1405228 [Trametopsis cervina]
MIKKNKATECGVTNGAEGVVVGWKSRPIDKEHSTLEILFVKLTSPSVNIKLEGLEENVVPVASESINITCRLPNGKQQTINRTQVPAVINFAMTDYASQGRTRKYNVVDIHNCRSHQSIYTCLSRGYLRQEFRELEILDEITKLKFDRKLPAGVGGMTRNHLISSYRKQKGSTYVPKTMPLSLKWSENDDYKLQDPFDAADWQILDKSKKKKSDKEDKSEQKPVVRKPKVDVRNFVPAQGTVKLDVVSHEQVDKFKKKRKHNDPQGAINAVIETRKSPKGFIWDENTYSCAFDSLFTILKMEVPT